MEEMAFHWHRLGGYVTGLQDGREYWESKNAIIQGLIHSNNIRSVLIHKVHLLSASTA
jgi:hypothetical protein